LAAFDYSDFGNYFITICTRAGVSLFGRFKNDALELNKGGVIVKKYPENIPMAFKNLFLDEYIIMPVHLQAIIQICGAA